LRYKTVTFAEWLIESLFVYGSQIVTNLSAQGMSLLEILVENWKSLHFSNLSRLSEVPLWLFFAPAFLLFILGNGLILARTRENR
jgi:hypothetical protein